MKTEAAINILGDFCGQRDVNALAPSMADVMVLFGGSILAGGDVLAEAMQNHVAEKYIIVGGAGHTTQALREKIHLELPDIPTENEPEARLFAAYLREKYGLTPDFLECKSTNCGNNITNLLELIAQNNLKCHCVILCQDATMQRRMGATLAKYRPDMEIIGYAAYHAEVIRENGALTFARSIRGMWDMERYISLLLGEIPRLTDDANGYGPNGKDFIAHVDIPGEVRAAFDTLSERYHDLIRVANPKFA